MQTRKGEAEYSKKQGSELLNSSVIPSMKFWFFTYHSGFLWETPDKNHFMRLQKGKPNVHLF